MVPATDLPGNLLKLVDLLHPKLANLMLSDLDAFDHSCVLVSLKHAVVAKEALVHVFICHQRVQCRDTIGLKLALLDGSLIEFKSSRYLVVVAFLYLVIRGHK